MHSHIKPTAMEVVMAGKVLVLGAGGAFGGATAAAFASAGWQVSRYARGSDMAAAARGMDLIVNGLNPPGYHDWARLIPQITAQVLAAVQASGATVLVPGNVYVYGCEPGLWGPDTPHRPVSRKGAIRATMEAQYRIAAEAGQARVIILRGGDFMASAAPGSVLARVVLKGVAKGRIVSLGDPDARRAYAWLPDMARAAVALAEMRDGLPAFSDLPFAGHCFCVNDLAAVVARLTGRPVAVGHFAWSQLRLLSPFWELARELGEMRYLYDLPHSLSSTELDHLLPEFQITPLDQIVALHLAAAGVRAG
ncbi:MAG: NAD-dependent epimerase/dehydratase family protein [Pseudorhodobacter sp.]|nr:NAD-dependent epimerase/dehydratase family protein [Pseudorhodobacter sp.]